MIPLYEHQMQCVSDIRRNFSGVKRVLLQLPTGGGKTRVSAHMMDLASKKGNSCFFICHRVELINQTAVTLEEFNLEFGFIASGYESDYSKKIQICSIDTLKNRLNEIPSPSLVIYDECQFIAADGWSRVQRHFDGAYQIGLSATPTRLSGEGLDAHFDKMVVGKSVRWLIDNGYLANYKMFSVKGVDTSGLKTKIGEYTTESKEQAMDKPSITGDIVKHWLKQASDKLTIGFAPSVRMSEKYAEAFTLAGIPSIHLDGKTPKDKRKDALIKLAKGEYKVVWNVGLFGIGFDISANSGMDVTIGCVIDASPTQSLMMWMQRCGRGIRKQDGRPVILDHAGNFETHGFPCQDREWSLTSTKRSKKDKIEPDVLAKQCEQCFCCHKPAPACPECGYIYPVIERKIEEKEGELVEVTEEMHLKKLDRMQQGMADSVEKLMALGHSRKRAQHIVEARQVKESLQNELFKLTDNLTMAEIKRMKPKQLKQEIENVKIQRMV